MISAGNSGLVRVIGMKEYLLHPKRIEDAESQKLIEGLAGSDFHDSAQCVKRSERTVRPARTRLEIQRRGAPPWNVVSQCIRGLASDPGHLRPAGGTAAEPRDVGEKILNSDFPGCWDCIEL